MVHLITLGRLQLPTAQRFLIRASAGSCILSLVLETGVDRRKKSLRLGTGRTAQIPDVTSATNLVVCFHNHPVLNSFPLVILAGIAILPLLVLGISCCSTYFSFFGVVGPTFLQSWCAADLLPSSSITQSTALTFPFAPARIGDRKVMHNVIIVCKPLQNTFFQMCALVTGS